MSAILFMNFIFLFVIGFNLYRRKKNLIQAEMPKTAWYGGALLFLLGLMTWFCKDQSVLGLVTVFLAVGTFLSTFLAMGINHKGVNCFMGTNWFIQFIPYQKVKGMKLIYTEGQIQLQVEAYGDFVTLSFDTSKKELFNNLLLNNCKESKLSRTYLNVR
ncbi:hypothetical protein D3H64_01875 [Atopobacter sp. AH10]|uniref:hypothetical protein n=1 Tax=Atopobacter sp. AH10 TaxID=2315861 RepID=UPI000EF2106E|nr:hypothetical protein [Atopobacter sp. AH10]RLK63918.1 hypothetical protein D3H64_01875 [Atopobacter sp. AH10]